jgi:hypothetical protein
MVLLYILVGIAVLYVLVAVHELEIPVSPTAF